MSCWRLLNDRRDQKLQVVSFSSCFIMALILLYGVRLLNRVRPIIQTTLIVWLLARYCEGKDLYYSVDVFTIYLLVWQCVYVMCKWEDNELSFPFLILQQGSLCISAAVMTFLFYDFQYRFFPIQFNFALLWLWALYDV
jgi:hypothetical protein